MVDYICLECDLVYRMNASYRSTSNNYNSTKPILELLWFIIKFVFCVNLGMFFIN